ncbi:MAG: alpha-L-arabinofuranosidase [Armatimonadetes bacterium]|nr:alpha-L-arabinofuranosidase [Armatimonadota bacterium]
MQRHLATGRREFIAAIAGFLSGSAHRPGGHFAMPCSQTDSRSQLRISPTPRFALSRNLFMQFMEPLGVTDSSVEAAWDHRNTRWRPDVVETVKRLAPPLIRWGGILSAYYRWREGVGPRDRRRPYANLCWGGVETHQVGTHEFVDFCRQVGAQPFYCVNFESEGAERWRRGPNGEDRSAGPDEAAAWVDYCNNPGNADRRRNGAAEPFALKLWQIGNETSYSDSHYGIEKAAERTVAFAKAMRKADPKIDPIGWGDSGWARRMLEVAGEHLQYIAFHHHFGSGLPDSPLHGNVWRADPDRTWEHLMHAHRSLDAKLREMREQVSGRGVTLAMTEGHFALPGRNRCEVLSTWAAGVANARMLNVQARHGDLLKIATLADFCGTRWQVNAVMIPVPGGRPFLMPVARVMALFRHHVGDHAVEVVSTPDGLDVTASRTGDRLYLHVVNTRRLESVDAQLSVVGPAIARGRSFTLAADPECEIIEHQDGVLEPLEAPLPPTARWTFPPASVTALELDLEQPSRAAGR